MEKSRQPGKSKAWCYQHRVLPKFLWSCLVYDFPVTTVATMEKRLMDELTWCSQESQQHKPLQQGDKVAVAIPRPDGRAPGEQGQTDHHAEKLCR